ncbi:MAG: hypothetical protein IJV50_08005 [Lachnospiraceae bacterium]|nr:hypothetical protein [Lachnospiraceae bacterium]
MEFTWDANSELGTKIEDDAFSIIANEAGLLSMANHCLNMAQESLDVYDLPFDVGCELEEGSEYFVLVKTPTPEKYLE